VPVAAAQSNATRYLVLGWGLWLLGSWTVTLSISPASVAARWMVFSSAVGLMVLWPLLRLSQDIEPHIGVPQTLWDWLCLNLAFQAAIWPLQVNISWSLWQVVWIDAAIAAWSLLTGALIATGIQWRSGIGRMFAMAMCLAMLLGEPLVIWLINLTRPGDPVGWTLRISPLSALGDLTGGGPQNWTLHVIAVVVAAAALWSMAARRAARFH
jgi:hypothetical protein